MTEIQKLVHEISERYQARKLERIKRSGGTIVRIGNQTHVFWLRMFK